MRFLRRISEHTKNAGLTALGWGGGRAARHNVHIRRTRFTIIIISLSPPPTFITLKLNIVSM